VSTSTEQSTFAQILSMSRFEWKLGSRAAAWKLLMSIFFLYGCSIGHVDGNGAGAVAYATGEAGWQIVGLAAIVWMSLLGAREVTLRTKSIVFAKPQPGEVLVISRFVGAMAQNVCFLLALFAGSILLRVLAGSSPAMLFVFVPQFGRSLSVVFFASAASFTLSMLSESVIAGMLVCLYLVLANAGKSFLAKYLDPSPIQNVGPYIAIGAALLCVAMRLYARKRRGSAPSPGWIATAAFVFVCVTVWQFVVVVRGDYDPRFNDIPALSLMQTQDSAVGLRASGFLLPDQDGRQIGIAQYSGSILVIALWSPNDPDSTLLLSHLNAIQAQGRANGVQVVAICLSVDNLAARTFAYGEGLHFPVVTDWGTTSVPEKLGMSPMSSAYRATVLPMVAVTDRRRRIVDIARGTACYEGATLDRIIESALSKDR
jgi:peroxiredoxin